MYMSFEIIGGKVVPAGTVIPDPGIWDLFPDLWLMAIIGAFIGLVIVNWLFSEDFFWFIPRGIL
jgi:hypothetical protein